MEDHQDIGKSSKTRAIVLKPGEGRSYWVLGDLYTFKVVRDDTRGSLAMVEVEVQPENGPPPHIHHREDETFYVLDGDFSFLHGEHTYMATGGSFVHIPMGTIHTFKNVGETIGRLLVAITPAGFERFFEEVGEPCVDRSAPPPVSKEAVQRLLALAPKYHLEVIPAPAGTHF
jgi:quercetin dioxygenase-like cupin family protein